jgi:hypothetical protein
MIKKITSEKAGLRDDDDEPAGDPPGLVVLKAAVYIMGVMIVLGVLILVYTLISRAGKLEPGISSVDEIVRIATRPGDTVQSVSLDRGSLAIHLRDATGKDSIVIYSLSREKVVRRLDVAPE